jgi:hypothetical protein
MKEGLSIKFNHKSKKEIKTEDDIKVGTRTDRYGNKMMVRAGKIISHTTHQKEKLNEFRQAAGEAAAKKAVASREHHKPAHVQKLPPPSL